jgi:hypothetical protein
MRLAAAVAIHGGGPGSGRHPGYDAAYKKHRDAYAALYGMNSISLKPHEIRKHLEDLHDGMVGMGAKSPGREKWVASQYKTYTKNRGIKAGGPGSGNFGHGGTGRNPAAIIFNNRVKKAGKIARLLIKHNFGSSMARRMRDEHWQKVADVLKLDEPPSPTTRAMVIGMLDKRWKVKAK